MATSRGVGMRLRKLRAAQGMTQVALAKQAKVSQGFIAQLEGGSPKDPRLSTLRRLAKALKTTVGELVE
ncbi:MAG: helix-turn-helix transcriptional regulator [Nitrospira sp.]|nr:helix-turn-helix transcriptional regulator [Nitrospira sp.]